MIQRKKIEPSRKDIPPNSFFPIKVWFEDTKKEQIINSPDEIGSGRPFRVLDTNVGIKPLRQNVVFTLRL